MFFDILVSLMNVFLFAIGTHSLDFLKFNQSFDDMQVTFYTRLMYADSDLDCVSVPRKTTFALVYAIMKILRANLTLMTIFMQGWEWAAMNYILSTQKHRDVDHVMFDFKSEDVHRRLSVRQTLCFCCIQSRGMNATFRRQE